VVNHWDETEVLESEEKPILDIMVRYQPGLTDVIRDWCSEGREITPEMRKLKLGPGESRTIEMTWIPPDIGYGTSVDLFGVFHDQYSETKVSTELCVEDGCAEY
jgi:hypothetical protein